MEGIIIINFLSLLLFNSDQQSQFVGLQSFDEAYVQLNTLQWTPSQLEAFEELVSNSTLRAACINLSPVSELYNCLLKM